MITATLWLHSPTTEAIGWTLLHSLWQFSLLAAIALAGLLLLRRATANIRYWFCCGIMISLGITPLITFGYQSSKIDAARPYDGPPTLSTSPSAFPSSTGMPLPSTIVPPTRPAPPATFRGIVKPLLPYAVFAYLAGALAFSLRLSAGYFRLRRIRLAAVTARRSLQEIGATLVQNLAIRRTIRLLESALVEVPSVIGAIRPVILFPASALTGLSADEITGLLAHELAHIKRHDYAINLLQCIMETLLFYHPATWWLSTRIRQEREHCCDDSAVSAGVSRVAYARALAGMESLRVPSNYLLAANTGSLLPRIRRILNGPLQSACPRSITLLTILLPATLLATLLLIVACKRTATAPEAAASQSSTTPAITMPQPGDIIRLTIIGLPPPNAQWQRDEAVDAKGNISILYIGSVHVAGLTTREIEEQIAAQGIAEHVLTPKDAANPGPKIVALLIPGPHAESISLEELNLMEDERQGDDNPANLVVRQHLEMLVKELAADHQDFQKVIDFLRDSTNTNIFVNWSVLHKAGIERDTPVTLYMNHVPFQKVLTTVLSEVGAGKARLDYAVEDGIITISTYADLEASRPQVVRIFDIRDLLVGADSNATPPFGAMAADKKSDQNLARNNADVIKDIIRTIQDTVAPDSWRDKGGTVGSIREINGQLVVNQTAKNQRAVFQLLNQLKETRGVKIAVEAQMILVDQETLAKLNLPNGENGHATGKTLTEAELGALLKTTKESPASTILTAPRVTLFNGQRGYIAKTTQLNYITGCRAKTDGNGKPAPDYKIDTLTTGVVLNLEATVSADQKWTVLKFKPAVRELVKMDTLPAPGMPQGEKFIIQKPELREAEMSAMVSIPDGGTVVFGGITTQVNLPKAGEGWTSVEGAEASKAGERRLLVLFHTQNIVPHEVEK